MQKYPQIQSLKEANLLLGTRRTFGIYQIKDDSPGENYAFMNMRFIESHGMQIKKEDYKLVYVGDLSGNMSLEDILKGSTLTDRKTSEDIPCLSVIS